MNTRLPAARRLFMRVAGPLLVMLATLPAHALDCPEPPRQTQKDWDVDVQAEVGRIGPVRGAELRTKVRSVTHDLMSRMPGADKLYLEQMMFSAYCSALRDDHNMAEGAKARQILDYRRELQRALKVK
ncbi:hypothetical protein ACWA7J_04935 [Leptothrix sp. BB-4]